MTTHPHRLLLIVPLDRVADVVAWLKSAADRTCPDDLGPGLCAAGDAKRAVTHRWQSAAWPDEECRGLLGQLCDLAGVAELARAQWDAGAQTQKRSWLAGVRGPIRAGCGAFVQMSDGPGAWELPEDALEAMGLEVADREG